jgi:multicomponent Na+:H+ antiporter subunit D
MRQQLPALIVVLPLVVSFLVFFSGWWFKRAVYPLVMATMACCFLACLAILKSVIVGGQIQYRLGGWAPPWGIEYAVDHLNALLLVLVTFLSLLTAWHGRTAVEAEMPRKTSLFWTLYLLLVTGLSGIVITSDVFNLFVLLEVASLSGYTLIALGKKRAAYASLRYVFIGTIGASFYLLGVGYLYISTGSLNMSDLAQLLTKLHQSKAVLAGFTFIAIGLSIKMALFPMHSWLPDAYTYAPDPVSTAVAPLMTKVMAYAIMRMFFTVFGVEFSIALVRVSDLMVWFGTFAILFGAVMALSQDDFKRMLSFVIVAEMGYIVGGIGVANANALKGAVFHIVNDAVMVACLFMVAGMVVNKTGGHRIEDFKGMFRSMPITASIFSVGALAVIGVPPTCGFFSKWYLVLGGIEARQWGFVAALLVCTLINVALFFRIVDLGLYVHARDVGPAAKHASTLSSGGEAPLSMVLPASVLAIAIVLIGVFNQTIVNTVIRFAIPKGL